MKVYIKTDDNDSSLITGISYQPLEYHIEFEVPDEYLEYPSVKLLSIVNGEVVYTPKVTKDDINRSIANIVVTTSNGNTFQGNTTSQTRMANAIAGTNSLDHTIEWILADNTIATITFRELKEALNLATSNMSDIITQYKKGL